MRGEQDASDPDRALRIGLDLRLAGYRSGGIARYARDLHAALAHLPELQVIPFRSVRDRTTDPRGVRLRTPPHHRWERRAVSTELRLSRRHIDVYHSPDFIVPTGLHVPAVATVHDLAFLHWPEDLTEGSLRYYRQLQASARDTAAWIVPSEWTAADLARSYSIGREKIHVIPHGVPLRLGDTAATSQSARRAFVLAVGTIEPRKRYDLLLDALDLVDNLHAIVIGQPGWNSDAIQHRLCTHPRVTWLRGVDDAWLGRFYREAIAVVIPSRAEGFGLPALEAMAAGTPVVSSGGGALPEVTGDVAVHPRDATPDAWAEAIASIIADEQAWTMLSASGRNRARGFTWERAARQTLEVYRSVVSGVR